MKSQVSGLESQEFTWLLGHADDNMVLAQQLGEWISRAPELEEDIALGNIALDHLGVARALYTLAGATEGLGRDEDDLAMFRDEHDYWNLLLMEQPNGDFANTMVRQLFIDSYQLPLWEDLSSSGNQELAGIAGRALKEARYHFRHSSGWVIRLGDGTEESTHRTQQAVDELWPFTDELCAGDRSAYRPSWEKAVVSVLSDARLAIPNGSHQHSGGREGLHSEHLAPLLAEMQWMQRSHPGLKW
jgi:ring-1,2-phenylacetyl-CoA epoxidase subunit PaaC